ncbi:MAG TPA: DUF4263 domain-containing protein [Chitinophagales bacterium]|nr:DUF4263 domain-containing protein [Chitinophagales bacterium]
MEQYTVNRTSKITAEVLEDFVIDETSLTRRIFRALIVDNPKDSSATVSGYLIYQRKGKNQKWEDISDSKLNQLKSGDGIKFHFSCGELKKFNEILEQSYALGNSGITSGKKNLVVAEANRVIEVPAERNALIKKLLAKNFGREIWEEILSSDPDLATRLSNSKIQTDRKRVLEEFEISVSKNKDEHYWQSFFEKNTWIFGYGLKYHFLHLLQAQPHYGGTNVTGKGAQKGDYLMYTSATESRFTVLVEIKKPDTQLFQFKKSGELLVYRNGAPVLNYELTGAISQIQVNSNTWEAEGAKAQQNAEQLRDNKIYTHSPKGILVIGHTSQLDNFDKRRAFELFRANIHNPEIVTFDELFERARYIVGEVLPEVKADAVNKFSHDDDLPF